MPQEDLFELWLAHEACQHPGVSVLTVPDCICHLPCGDRLKIDRNQPRNQDGSVRVAGRFVLAMVSPGVYEHVGCSKNPAPQFRARKPAVAPVPKAESGYTAPDEQALKAWQAATNSNSIWL